MQVYYYVIMAIALLIIALFVRFLIVSGKNIPVKLFSKALKNENNGDFEEAVINYQCALDEVKKFRFHGQLESKIIEKLTVLNKVIEYEHNARFTEKWI